MERACPVFSIRGVGGPIGDALLYALITFMSADSPSPLRMAIRPRRKPMSPAAWRGLMEGARAEAAGSRSRLVAAERERPTKSPDSRGCERPGSIGVQHQVEPDGPYRESRTKLVAGRSSGSRVVLPPRLPTRHPQPGSGFVAAVVAGHSGASAADFHGLPYEPHPWGTCNRHGIYSALDGMASPELPGNKKIPFAIADDETRC
jgi:hypothetical protein